MFSSPEVGWAQKCETPCSSLSVFLQILWIFSACSINKDDTQAQLFFLSLSFFFSLFYLYRRKYLINQNKNYFHDKRGFTFL